jgi:hypothetical protein
MHDPWAIPGISTERTAATDTLALDANPVPGETLER